jgi:threonylcarbamoyladenosine tRNA methylthiotransferase MtaB
VGQLRRFVSEGYGEVVLSGIHLGQWGRDLHPPGTLPGLLRACMDAAGGARLRLSSLEPHEWTDELLNVLGDSPGVCPHFHVPLQSGDPKILEAMGRPYTPDEYAALVLELRRRFPDAAIGADVLVGFPGESETRFRNTLELVERLPLIYLHVFPFSPRPGTPAAGFSDRPHGPKCCEIWEGRNGGGSKPALSGAAWKSSWSRKPPLGGSGELRRIIFR